MSDKSVVIRHRYNTSNQNNNHNTNKTTTTAVISSSKCQQNKVYSKMGYEAHIPYIGITYFCKLASNFHTLETKLCASVTVFWLC